MQERIYKKQTAGGQILIMDRKDDSVIFYVHKGKKDAKALEAIITITLDALNSATTTASAKK